jgi:hypothetical protein
MVTVTTQSDRTDAEGVDADLRAEDIESLRLIYTNPESVAKIAALLAVSPDEVRRAMPAGLERLADLF